MLFESFLVLIKHFINIRASVFGKIYAGFEVLLFLIPVENASPYLNVSTKIIVIVIGDNDWFFSSYIVRIL